MNIGEERKTHRIEPMRIPVPQPDEAPMPERAPSRRRFDPVKPSSPTEDPSKVPTKTPAKAPAKK
jgi:hypothetical protein